LPSSFSSQRPSRVSSVSAPHPLKPGMSHVRRLAVPTLLQQNVGVEPTRRVVKAKLYEEGTDLQNAAESAAPLLHSPVNTHCVVAPPAMPPRNPHGVYRVDR
jgi:hypothetical protein